MEIKLYVEGGGNGSHRRATIKLQQGFNTFFKELKEAAHAKKIGFKIIPAGDTQSTYDDFIFSIKNSPQSFNLLLVDSDEALDDNESARAFLQKKHQKWKLKTVNDEQCHLMVQIMESWFLADIKELGNFYGKDFKKNVLPKNQDVEKIPKADVEDKLKRATEKTTKGDYHKIKHGAELLEKIDVEKVRQASKHCNRLFETIYLQIS